MAAVTGPRKTISIYDYPEHLNPFHEEDNHNKIRFWTIGRKQNRSNSISFSGIKDLRNSWAFRSFIKSKGKKDQQTSSKDTRIQSPVNGGGSPVMYRRAMQYSSTSGGTGPGARSTVSSPERADRYVYGGSVTPLPRSRFQERLRSTSHYDTNSLSTTPRMARSEVSGSRLSMESTNPFDEEPVPPARAHRRKKKRAPPPPPASADNSVSNTETDLQIVEVSDHKTETKNAAEQEEINFNVELKIVEDQDSETVTTISSSDVTGDTRNDIKNKDQIEPHENKNNCTKESQKNENEMEVSATKKGSVKNSDSEDDILDKVSFPKVDIVKYRRNSSLNEDDIRLRRGNLEDFHALTNKRSKSLTNALDAGYMAYDIDLNDNRTQKDTNCNEEPQKLVCKLYIDETARKHSIDNSISSTEREFLEIDKATRELEREISKLNTALIEEDNVSTGARLSVADIKRRFDKPDIASPNPIPKPRRSHYGDSTLPLNGNVQY